MTGVTNHPDPKMGEANACEIRRPTMKEKNVGDQSDQLVERIGHESGHDANAGRKKRDQDDAKRRMMGAR